MEWFQSIHGDRVPDPIVSARTGIVVRTPAIRVRLGWLIAWKIAKGIGLMVYLYVRHLLFTGPATAVVLVAWVYGWRGLGLVTLSVAALGGLWRWRHRESLRRFVLYPLRAKVRRIRLNTKFAPAMVTSGLAIAYRGQLLIPQVVRFQSRRWFDVVTVRMVAGQIPEDFARVALRLAHTFDVRMIKVHPGDRPDRVVLHLLHGDPLARIVKPMPVVAVPNFTALVVALQEDGMPFALSLFGNQFLVVGATGSGKSSAAWSFIRALAGGVASGLVRLWVFDPKGGMEMSAGAPMFDRFLCEGYGQMADSLDTAVREMRERASRLRGITRQHTPSATEPVTVIVIDELAALTAYADRAMRERIKQSLGILLTQGRAVGFHVLAMVQDPRKEVLPFRDLFTIRIGLRMNEPEQVDLVLGDGARDQGALCDRISAATPGVAYALQDGNPVPAPVRFSYLSDEDIAEMARAYGRAGVINGHTLPSQRTSDVIDLPNSGWRVNR